MQQVWCPKNWYINNTPSGCFSHVAKEVKQCEFLVKEDPKFVALLVGTNDTGSHCDMKRAEASFQNLLIAVNERFPSSQVGG